MLYKYVDLLMDAHQFSSNSLPATYTSKELIQIFRNFFVLSSPYQICTFEDPSIFEKVALSSVLCSKPVIVLSLISVIFII